MSRPWTGGPVAVLDTETTDLLGPSCLPAARQPRVYEIGLLLASGPGLTLEPERVACLVDPGVPIPAESTKITGIDDDQVRGAPGLAALRPRIAALLERADAVIGHNLAFDRGVMDCEADLRGWPPWPWPEYQACTVELTEWLYGYRLKLDSLCEELGVAFSGRAHRADVDARATLDCFRELVARGWTWPAGNEPMIGANHE